MKHIESIKQIIKFMKFTGKYFSLQFFLFMLIAVLSLLDLTGPIINKIIIDDFLIGKNLSTLYLAIILMAIILLFSSAFTISKDYLLSYMGNQIAFNIRKNVFETIVKMKTEEIPKVDIGEVFIAFDKDIYNIEQTINKTIAGFSITILNFALVSIFMLVIGWQYFLATIIVVPLYLINNKIWREKLSSGSNNVRQSVVAMFQFVSEALNNSRFIKLSAKQSYAEMQFLRKNKNMIDEIFLLLKSQVCYNVSCFFLGFIDRVILLVVGGIMVYKGEISIGAYFALTSYSGILKSTLMSVISFDINMVPTMVSMQKVERILGISKEELSGCKLKILKGDLEFENVDFFYEKDKPVINNLNLKIKNGEKVAFVGESGSGKTSLVNLITGLYRPQKGRLIIDNKPMNELNIQSYRKKIGIVTQDSYFFKDTIRNNLLLGSKVSDDEIMRICSICQIDKYIDSLPQGIDTVIEMNASNLSGGQKQRLSIARMLIQKPDIVILDEATSALDNLTESLILSALDKELAGKTVIAIAHRLTTIENADRIVVLKNGKIVEEGSHDTLMKLEGYYYKLKMVTLVEQEALKVS